ncbi:hypothetical protein B0H11DRAFT_1936670 [Mycena galericulata]|nr:hypothetical protein B0H11DRAFT_1936670 [Mycena galericulata]
MPPRNQAHLLATLFSPEFLRIAPYVPLPRLHAFSHYRGRQHLDTCCTGGTDGEGIERPRTCLQYGELVQFDWDWGNFRVDLSTIVDDYDDDEMPGLMSQDESDCQKTGRVRGFKPRNLTYLAHGRPVRGAGTLCLRWRRMHPIIVAIAGKVGQEDAIRVGAFTEACSDPFGYGVRLFGAGAGGGKRTGAVVVDTSGLTSLTLCASAVEILPVRGRAQNFGLWGFVAQRGHSGGSYLCPMSSTQPAGKVPGSFFIAFAAVPQSASQPNPHAQAQARYRTRNKVVEQEKARARMSRLRGARRDDAAIELRRKKSSEKLRATPLFAIYRAHARHHLAPLLANSGDETPQPEVWAEVDRELGVDEVAACLGNFQLVFKITDARAVASFDKMLVSGADLDDDDIEFMLRHQFSCSNQTQFIGHLLVILPMNRQVLAVTLPTHAVPPVDPDHPDLPDLQRARARAIAGSSFVSPAYHKGKPRRSTEVRCKLALPLDWSWRRTEKFRHFGGLASVGRDGKKSESAGQNGVNQGIERKRKRSHFAPLLGGHRTGGWGGRHALVGLFGDVQSPRETLPIQPINVLEKLLPGTLGRGDNGVRLGISYYAHVQKMVTDNRSDSAELMACQTLLMNGEVEFEETGSASSHSASSRCDGTRAWEGPVESWRGEVEGEIEGDWIDGNLAKLSKDNLSQRDAAKYGCKEIAGWQ